MIGSAVLNDFGDALHLFDLRNDAVSGVASLEFVGRRKSSVSVNVERNPERSSINGILENAVAVDASVFVICDAGDFCNLLGLLESVDFVEKVVDVLDFHLSWLVEVEWRGDGTRAGGWLDGRVWLDGHKVQRDLARCCL